MNKELIVEKLEEIKKAIRYIEIIIEQEKEVTK
jgi:hypothetical protein